MEYIDLSLRTDFSGMHTHIPIKVDRSTAISLEAIFADMHGYVYFKNSQSQYIWCNNNLAKISQLKDRADIKGKTDYDFQWGKYLADQFAADDQKVMREALTLTKEYLLPIKRKDGHYLYIRTNKIPLYDEQGDILGILAIAVDITEQKILEKETYISHAFIEDILYNLPGFIYWKNKKSQYVGFNKNVERLSGLTRKELLGKTDLDLDWGRKESVAKAFQKDDLEVMETGIIKVTEHEIPIKSPTGHYMVVRTEKSRLHDRNGNVVGVLGVAMDITEQKILEAELIAEKQRVEVLNQQKTEFIRNMEHDIRTPFTGVYSISSILAEKETNKEKKLHLDAISQCSKELLDYCNGILDFSKIESGTSPILEKKFNLKTIVSGIIKMESPAIVHKHLNLIEEYADNTPKIFIGDPYRLQRILLNLVSNAIKFTQKGHVRISVRLAKNVNEKNCILRLSVEDTGIGIPLEKQAYIYERFNRLTPANQNKYKGTGLGLAIVKHLIYELDGEIDVASSVGIGTTFVCTIPFKRPLLDDILFEGTSNE